MGIGLDVVELSRISAIYKHWGLKFVQKILTVQEQESMPGQAAAAAYLASRFAAKEAAVKALGTGFSMGISFRHIIISRGDLGKPELYFQGPALERCRMSGVDHIHVSLSHGRDTAAAVVILENSKQTAPVQPLLRQPGRNAPASDFP